MIAWTGLAAFRATIIYQPSGGVRLASIRLNRRPSNAVYGFGVV